MGFVIGVAAGCGPLGASVESDGDIPGGADDAAGEVRPSDGPGETPPQQAGECSFAELEPNRTRLVLDWAQPYVCAVQSEHLRCVRLVDGASSGKIFELPLPGAVHALAEEMCVLTTTGEVWCVVGVPTPDFGSINVFQQVPHPDGLPFVDFSSDRHCGVDCHHAMWCLEPGRPMRWSRVADLTATTGKTGLSDPVCYTALDGRAVCSPPTTAHEWVESWSMLAVGVFWRYSSMAIVYSGEPVEPPPRIKACGVHGDGVECWLRDAHSEVLRSAVLDESGSQFEPRRVAKLAVGLQDGCLLTTDGEVYCWNFSEHRPDADSPAELVARRVEAGGASIDLAVTMGHACLMRDDEEVWCWKLEGASTPPELAIAAP